MSCVYCSIVAAWLTIFHAIALRFPGSRYVSVNSSSAHPPRANPRALAFYLKKWANSLGWGHINCLNALGWGRRKRANAPSPGSSPSNTSTVHFINHWIKRSTVQYFNATVLKTSSTTVRVSWFWLYLFLYILFSFNSLLQDIILSSQHLSWRSHHLNSQTFSVLTLISWIENLLS